MWSPHDSREAGVGQITPPPNGVITETYQEEN